MTLRPLELADMELIRQWRNASPETLRTPFPLTREQQEDWYRTVICDRRGSTRYWGVSAIVPAYVTEDVCLLDGNTVKTNHSAAIRLVGYGGIENIQQENRLGEISILIAPEYRGKGYGEQAVSEFLHRAFRQLNLANVWGECYTCSRAISFWKRMIEMRGAYSCQLPARKYWEGTYWPSLYFNFCDVNWITEEGDATVVSSGGKRTRIRGQTPKEYGDA
jgi:RimJ/RimL family protein N-acetyltransferase